MSPPKKMFKCNDGSGRNARRNPDTVDGLYALNDEIARRHNLPVGPDVDYDWNTIDRYARSLYRRSLIRTINSLEHASTTGSQNGECGSNARVSPPVNPQAGDNNICNAGGVADERVVDELYPEQNMTEDVGLNGGGVVDEQNMPDNA